MSAASKWQGTFGFPPPRQPTAEERRIMAAESADADRWERNHPSIYR